MPLHNQLPASLRYLKARLRPLTRPPVWGTAIFISVVGLVAWEYWVNPGLLQSSETNAVAESKKSNNPSLSPEDSAIGADIDSSPVLARELSQPSIPVSPLIPPKTQETKTKGLFEDSGTEKAATDTQLIPNTATSTSAGTAPTTDNPFLVQAQNLLQTGQLHGVETPLAGNSSMASARSSGQASGSSYGSGLPGANQNQTTPSNSAQTGLNQSPSADPANRTTDSQVSANALGPSFTTITSSSQTGQQPNGVSNSNNFNQPTGTNNNYPANSYPYSAGPQSAPSAAPYAAPPIAPTTNIAPYSVQPNQATGGYTNPTVNSNSGTAFPQQQPSQLQQFFTTPQTTQRRPIGGNPVNPFGNP